MIDGITFEGNPISFGKINIIHGKNGSGKTRLLDELSRRLPHNVYFSHKIHVFGEEFKCEEKLSYGESRLKALGSVIEIAGNAVYLFDCPEIGLGRRMELEFVRKALTIDSQIFVATHSLFMMREFELSRAALRVFGIHNENGCVKVISGDDFAEPEDEIEALEESIIQSDRYCSLAWI